MSTHKDLLDVLRESLSPASSAGCPLRGLPAAYAGFDSRPDHRGRPDFLDLYDGSGAVSPPAGCPSLFIGDRPAPSGAVLDWGAADNGDVFC